MMTDRTAIAPKEVTCFPIAMVYNNKLAFMKINAELDAYASNNNTLGEVRL